MGPINRLIQDYEKIMRTSLIILAHKKILVYGFLIPGAVVFGNLYSNYVLIDKKDKTFDFFPKRIRG